MQMQFLYTKSGHDISEGDIMCLYDPQCCCVQAGEKLVKGASRSGHVRCGHGLSDSFVTRSLQGE